MKQRFLNYLVYIIVLIAVTACSKSKPQKVNLEWGCRMTIPMPAVLGEPFTAHHSLNFQAKEKSFQMHAQMEFENKILTIVGLNTAFATVFTLKQTENQIDYQANIKTPIKPKYILGTYYLIFTPIDKIKGFLGKNTTCLETTTETTRVRKIFNNKKVIFNIEYLPFKNGTKITFHNLKRTLTFTIIEDYRTNL